MTYRLFIAIPCLTARESLKRAQPNNLIPLITQSPSYETLHLTLAFFSDFKCSDLSLLVHYLSDCLSQYDRFQCVVDHLGCLDRGNELSWVAYIQPNLYLTQIHEFLKMKSKQLGWRMDSSEFKPHVTLLKDYSFVNDVQTYSLASHLTLNVERVQLLRSLLGQGPCQYEVLDEFLLNA